MDYAENARNRPLLREDSAETCRNIFAELRIRDMETLSLFNTLFGNHELDLINYAISAEKDDDFEQGKEELLRKMNQNTDERRTAFKRKHGLSKWLERRSGQFMESDLRSYKEEIGGLPFEQKLLLYLSAKQIQRATDHCKKHDINRLAVILSTLSSNHTTKETIKQQMKEWDKSNQTEYIATHQVYQFLSGDPSAVERKKFLLKHN